MEAYVRKSPGVSLRRINIGSWSSEVATQYGIRSIPHLVLFDDGRKKAEGTREVLGYLK